MQTTSLLKCPNQNCNFCSLSIPEIQTHIVDECNASISHSSQVLEYVDVKPQGLNLKREQNINVKQEAIDPLEKNTELKAEKFDMNEVQFNTECSENSEDVDDVEIPKERPESFTIDDDSCSEADQLEEAANMV